MLYSDLTSIVYIIFLFCLGWFKKYLPLSFQGNIIWFLKISNVYIWIQFITKLKEITTRDDDKDSNL